MKNKHLKLISCAFMASLFSLSSCVDNDYDLTEDIDLTIQVGGSEFAIPGGQTDSIKLSKVLDIDTNGIIKTDKEGNYYLLQESDENDGSTKISVDKFSVDAPYIAPVYIDPEITLPTLGGGVQLPSGERYDVELEQDKYNANFELTLNQDNGLPKELTSASYIEVTLPVSLDFSLDQDMELVDVIRLDEISIQFPKYLISNDLSDGKLSIDMQEASKSRRYQRAINVTAIDLSKLDSDGKEGTGIKDGKLDIKGTVTINGKISVLSDDINPNAGSNQVDLIVDVHLADMLVSAVTGVVEPDITINIDPVKLSDLPDFLSDEQVVLDVQNPMVFFRANNQTPVKAIVDGVISSYKVNEDGSKDQLGDPQYPVTFHIEMDKAQDQQFCLSPNRPENLAGATWVPVEHLSTLITKIPDEFHFDVTAVASKEPTTITLGSEFEIATSYEVNVPFVFGDNLSIVYKDTVDGWNSDLKDYEIKMVQATANVINMIPLGLNFTAEALQLDAQGKSVPLDEVSVVVKVNGDKDGVIAAGTKQTPTDSPLVVEITELKSGAVKKLDGLAFKAVAVSKGKSGQQLNENQALLLKNVRLKVPGGVKVDLN